MDTVEQKYKCDLCGESTSEPEIKTINGVDKHFCCDGCARAYTKAHQAGMAEEIMKKQKPTKIPLDFKLDSSDKAHFSIQGMWCAGCATAAENVLRNQPGVKSADISFAAERGNIRFDPQVAHPEDILNKLDSLGYKARVLTDRTERRVESQQENKLLQLIVAFAFSMQVMLLYIVELYPQYAAGNFTDPDVLRLQYLVWLLATPILLVGGFSFLSGAWRGLVARTANMDTLVSLGLISAYSYSAYVTLRGGGEAYFDSVAMITTFILLGRYLEVIGGRQARKDIRHLLRLQPDNAIKKVKDDFEEVSAYDLKEGDVILVKAGSRIPVDAEIIDGRAAINESALTGESTPVEKNEGDQVYAGTIVTESAITCEVQKPVQETRLAQITNLVEKTLSSKPPIQRLADRVSGYFAIMILLAAVLTGLGWSLAGKPTSESLLTAVSVLVVACPCALGLATPLAITVSLGRSAQHGILVRNAVAIENAARVKRVVFDKTGTLTRGKMSVVEVVHNDRVVGSPAELLCLAASVEQFSEHPVALAIVEACDSPKLEAREFKSKPGMGASAIVSLESLEQVKVGSDEFIDLDGTGEFVQNANKFSNRGDTVVWVGVKDQLAGYIVLRDEPQPEARETILKLNQQGIHTVMLSGDHPNTSQAIAQELGLTDFEGRCPPEMKAERISEWQTQGERVAMIGDGVNDAPALAQADLSITTAGGTNVAGETSDLVLMRPDLMMIPWFLALSQQTRRIITENLGWAFLYNLIAVPLAAAGLISPVIAAITMASSSLLVVGNSLRLRS